MNINALMKYLIIVGLIILSNITYAQLAPKVLNIFDIEASLKNRDKFKILMLDNNFQPQKSFIASADMYRIFFAKGDKTGQDEYYRNEEEKLIMSKLICNRMVNAEIKQTTVTFAINKYALPQYIEEFLKSIKEHYPKKVLVPRNGDSSEWLYYTKDKSNIMVYFNENDITFNIDFRYEYE